MTHHHARYACLLAVLLSFPMSGVLAAQPASSPARRVMSAPILPVDAGGVLYAFADLDGSGDYTEGDAVLAIIDPDATAAVEYQGLVAALTRAGGPLGCRDAAALVGRSGRAGRLSFMVFPESIRQPVLTIRLKMEGTTPLLEMTLLARADIVRSGDAAGVDLDGDGVCDPDTDALLRVSSQAGRNNLSGLASYDKLVEAIRAAGGRLQVDRFDSLLQDVAPVRGTISIGEYPETVLDAGEATVSRTLRLEAGRAWIEYALEP